MDVSRKRFLRTPLIGGAGAVARCFGLLLTLTLLFVVAPLTRAQSESSSTSAVIITDPLVRILISKGMLTLEEGRTIGANGTPEEQRHRLVVLMHKKGMITDAEFEALRAVTPPGNATSGTSVETALTQSPELKGIEKPGGSAAIKPPLHRQLLSPLWPQFVFYKSIRRNAKG